MNDILKVRKRKEYKNRNLKKNKKLKIIKNIFFMKIYFNFIFSSFI